MMPVIRVPDDVFRRLQSVATPLVDTPASAIEKLLGFYESNGGGATLPPSSPREASNPSPGVTTTKISYETYENRNNPHVTIHRVGCSQLRKRGGVHRYGQGSYKGHATLTEAHTYARTTGLPIKYCKFCTPQRGE